MDEIDFLSHNRRPNRIAIQWLQQLSYRVVLQASFSPIHERSLWASGYF